MKEYNVLVVEDLSSVVNVIKREMGKVLEKFQISVVETRYDFVGQLETFCPDLIITSYKLPTFDGLSVIKLTVEKSPYIPVIVFTGSLNEEAAVACMKAGAVDYILKEHSKQLGSAVVNALEQARVSREKSRPVELPISGEETYRYMFVSNPNPMYVLDLETLAFLEVNNATVEKYGYSREEFLTMTLRNICPVEDIPAGLKDDETLPKSYSTGKWWHLKKNGEIMHVEISSHPVEYNGRKARYAQVMDITERKKAWDALLESEDKYRKLFENVHDVYFQTDLEGTIYEISPSVDQFLGYSRDQLIGNSVAELYYDIKERDRMIKALLKNREILDYDARFRTRNDTVVHASVNARLIYTPGGKPDLIEGSIRDISDRIQAGQALRYNEEKFRSLFESQAAVELVADPDTQCIMDANLKAIRFYGWTLDELKHMKISEISTGTPEELLAMVEKIKTLGHLHYETRHRCSDGSLKDVEVFAAKILISGKDYLQTIVHDITNRKQEEQKSWLLTKSIEQSPVGIMVTDPEGGIEYVNPKFTKITGYTLNELKGKNQWFLYSGKHSGETYHEMWETVLSGKEWSGEYTVKRKNGDYYRENICINPIVNQKRQITHVVAVSWDSTDMFALLEDLRAAKLKAEETDRLKSSLIYNMSNAIRTPLNDIVGFTGILENQEFSTENKLNFVEIIKKSNARLLNTITDYLDFSMIASGKTAVYAKQFPVNTLLDELKAEFSDSCKEKGLKLTAEYPKASGSIQLNTDQEWVRKILTHLLRNAIKNTNKGTVDFGFRKMSDTYGFYVSDTGTGIDSLKVNSIFDYSDRIDKPTSRTYESNGLGLPIAQGLVRLLGGEIFVETLKDKGSTLSFTLPSNVVVITDTKVSVKKKQQTMVPNPLILVAEDDDNNFGYIETVLNRAGFKVVRAGTGTEAVNMCHTNPDINLVLMDLNMPVMGGLEATRQIKNFLPAMPVIAVTAYVSSDNESEAFLSGCEAFISKPVERAHLLESVGNSLGNKVN